MWGRQVGEELRIKYGHTKLESDFCSSRNTSYTLSVAETQRILSHLTHRISSHPFTCHHPTLHQAHPLTLSPVTLKLSPYIRPTLSPFHLSPSHLTSDPPSHPFTCHPPTLYQTHLTLSRHLTNHIHLSPLSFPPLPLHLLPSHLTLSPHPLTSPSHLSTSHLSPSHPSRILDSNNISHLPHGVFKGLKHLETV